jgi:hypothetical protein
MRKVAVAAFIIAALVGGLVAAWVRNPRIGSGRMNRFVNPILMGRGLAGRGRSEIGTIEHVGRTSGIRRLTPVHPVPTEDGFRFIVPLGLRSEWARNVVAAGHCRLQLHDTVYELDEPRLVAPGTISGLAEPGRVIAGRLGMLYLEVHTFASRPGTLEPADEVPAIAQAAFVPEAGAPGLAEAPVAPAEGVGGQPVEEEPPVVTGLA